MSDFSPSSLLELSKEQQESGHFPVMLPEVIAALQPRAGGNYLDGTFGGGGYSRAILQANDTCHVHAIDRDPTALARASSLPASLRERLSLHQGSFGDMTDLVGTYGPFDGIVLDLGVSSFQLDEGERGFSFRQDGPLDMRMSKEGRSASNLVNEEEEETLASLLYHYGEERRSRHIARAIVRERARQVFSTTGQLAELIRQTIPRERPNFDPATRSFQALRIAVNDELGELERALKAAPALLAPKGIFIVVSFHSLEDRIVKHALSKYSGRVSRPSRYAPVSLTMQEQPEFSLPHTRPLSPGAEEIRINPRSRSARLRSLQRNSTGATS